ncbi:MAG: peptidylprolyl isomerase, partial [Oscillospiraceae bacterium]|nr:peptidylprolyl isomerase [Oscillospiraceae bacterium]
YFDALDAQRLSDSFYAKLVAINELYYLAVKASAESVSQDDVYDYALENDFVCEREIFIAKSTPDAYKIVLQAYLDISNGADFEELLVEIGQDPSMKTRQSGYYFTKGWKVKEIENAVYGLKEGEISEIVTTPLGYHIIKRLPIKKDELLASPDYTLIAANTATEQFNEKLIEAQNGVTLTYVENFEGLSAILR